MIIEMGTIVCIPIDVYYNLAGHAWIRIKKAWQIPLSVFKYLQFFVWVSPKINMDVKPFSMTGPVYLHFIKIKGCHAYRLRKLKNMHMMWQIN